MTEYSNENVQTYEETKLKMPVPDRKVLKGDHPELIRSHNNYVRDRRNGWRPISSPTEPYNPGAV